MSMVLPCVRIAVVVIILASLCLAGDLTKVATQVDRGVPQQWDDRLQHESSGLEMRRPYERGKVPVVLIHGLWGFPGLWARMVEDLEPAIRGRCLGTTLVSVLMAV
jgi:hypothetical protein